MSAAAVVARWARSTEADLRSVLRASAQDVAENVSVGGAHSPGTLVDTGFALNKWDATLGTPPSTPESNPEGQTFSGVNPAMALTIASADLPDTITIYNNTEYLPFFEDGSKQPSAENQAAGYTSGWIAQTVHAWPTIVRLATARLRGRLR